MNLIELKSICKNDNIPIVRDDTILLINKIINQLKIKRILEIGTAYGYSSYAMSLNKSVRKIVTIEKNNANFLKAKCYLKDIKKIKIINGDIFEYKLFNNYDLIFIDGPKSNQDILFNRLKSHLKRNGIIIIDNIFLKKFNSKKNLTKNQLKLIEKVKNFNKFLRNLKDWFVLIKDIDDGVAIISKKQWKLL